MPGKPPLKGEHYLYRDEIYKVVTVSSATDEIIVEAIKDRKRYTCRYAVFSTAYERVLKVKVVADLLNRSPRSIYRYESRGIINKPKMYQTASGREVRFYRLQDIYEMHELISQIHRGRPRQDTRIVNNTMPDIGTLKIRMRERYGR